MYEEHLSAAEYYLTDVPVKTPLDTLLALPDYVADDPGAPIFNLPAAVARLLGRFGWERASKTLNPKIWAPSWTHERIQRFASSQFSERPGPFEALPGSQLAVPEFPGMGALRDLERPDFPRYEIVHLICAVDWEDGDRAIRVSDHERWWLLAGALQAALRTARTRLLILQVALSRHSEACELARSIVDEGGPAALVVACADPGLVNTYFVGLYAEVLHNQPLEFAVAPKPWTDQTGIDLNVNLYYGQGSSEALPSGRWLESLRERGRQLTRDVENAAELQGSQISRLRGRADPFLHRSQAGEFELRLNEATERVAFLGQHVVNMAAALESQLDWVHESEGAEPLSRIAEIVPSLEFEAAEATRLYTELETEVEDARENGPRVLNTYFADPATGRVLEPSEGLVTSGEYDFLVDVGPRWNFFVGLKPPTPWIGAGYASS